jgi:hypothetical protein
MPIIKVQQSDIGIIQFIIEILIDAEKNKPTVSHLQKMQSVTKKLLGMPLLTDSLLYIHQVV